MQRRRATFVSSVWLASIAASACFPEDSEMEPPLTARAEGPLVPVAAGAPVAPAQQALVRPADADAIRVTVTHGGAVPLAGYVVPISLDTRALVAARRVKSDCSDLSAYDADLSTPLPYWVSVRECNGPTTLVFTKVNAIPAGGEAHFYLVFGGGRPRVPPDPARVFAFFDDFDGTSLDEAKWTHFGNGTYEVANGLLTTQHANLLSAKQSAVIAGRRAIGIRTDAASGLHDDFELGVGTVTSVPRPSWLWVRERTGQFTSFISWEGTGMAVAGGARYCAGKTASPMPVFDGEWRDVEFRYDVHDGYVTHTVERLDGFTFTERLATSAACMPPESGPVLLGLDHATGMGLDPIAHVDWVYVRDAVDPEPEVAIELVAWAR
jgi:hypothetical protein